MNEIGVDCPYCGTTLHCRDQVGSRWSPGCEHFVAAECFFAGLDGYQDNTNGESAFCPEFVSLLESLSDDARDYVANEWLPNLWHDLADNVPATEHRIVTAEAEGADDNRNEWSADLWAVFSVNPPQFTDEVRGFAEQ